MFSWLKHLADTFGSKPRSRDWPRVRREHLRGEPACAACGRNRDVEVHHIIPFSVDPSLELDRSNLVTLCADPCHLLFGHLLNFRRFNPHVRQDAAAFLRRMRSEP